MKNSKNRKLKKRRIHNLFKEGKEEWRWSTSLEKDVEEKQKDNKTENIMM